MSYSFYSTKAGENFLFFIVFARFILFEFVVIAIYWYGEGLLCLCYVNDGVNCGHLP